MDLLFDFMRSFILQRAHKINFRRNLLKLVRCRIIEMNQRVPCGGTLKLYSGCPGKGTV